MRYLPALAILILTLTLSGCGTTASPATSTPSTTRTDVSSIQGQLEISMTTEAGGVSYTLAASPEQVWSALVAVHNALEIPLAVADTRARVLGNPQLTLTRRFTGEPLSSFLSCGVTGGVAANNYRIQLSLLTNLSPASGGGTRVRTVVDASGRDPFAGNPPVNCASTYGLERKIATLLNEAIQPSSPEIP